jgi:hypothetical protein
MQNFIDVLTACQNASGAGKKATIQFALATADVTTRKLFWYAMNPYITFGVRQFEMPTSYQKPGCADANQFFDLLEALSSRSVTGDAARAAVTKTLALYDKETAEFLTRVLEKDLRAGFSAETANKVWGDKVIPTFEVMLADKCETPEEFLEKITFPCQADFKYDGCLSASWTIDLKDGRTVTIGEFVDGQMEGDVLSYNVTTKKKEWKKIEARVKNSMPERTYEWFRLTLEDGTVLPPLTGNHRIWLPLLGCWRRVDELHVDDVILSDKRHHTFDGGQNGALDKI